MPSAVDEESTMPGAVDDDNSRSTMATADFTRIPPSAATARVYALQGGTLDMPKETILNDQYGRLLIPDMCFLIENSAGRRVVFDLGIKVKMEDNPPVLINHMFDSIIPLPPARSIAQQLEDGGIDLASIESAIYSHTHFDHVGDLSHFPASTELVLGPGAVAVSRPGYPTEQMAPYMESDIPTEGRVVREIAQEQFTVAVGAFNGYDLFGDGSMYLLDAPGHIKGHLAALVRTESTAAEGSHFLLLGADAAHHRLHYSCCLAHGHNPKVGIFPHPVTGAPITMHSDIDEAYKTISKLRRMDEEENILVTSAHDIYMERVLHEANAWFPNAMTEWNKLGWRERVHHAVLQT